MSLRKAGLVGLLAAAALAIPASAATVEELQAQVNALLAQLAGLQGGSSAGAGCYTFTADLTIGSTGADVTALQNYLAGTGHFTASATGYFGPITQAAVAAWQSANGVSPAAGYFGAISRAKYNSMCGGSTTGGGSTSGGTLGGGEGDLSNFDASSGDDSEVEEGSDGDVFEFEFDVDDADVEVQRVDVMFTLDTVNSAAGADDQPWDVFDEITLMLDGDEVDSIDGSDEDNWDEDASDEYRLRFTGLDTVVEEDETAEFVLNVSVQNNIDEAGDVTWELWIEDDGIRALDGEGIDHEIGDDTDTVSFDVDVAGAGEELTIAESDNNPDATVLELEDDAKSDWMTVLGFTMEADENDIEVTEIPVLVTVSSSTYANFIDDAVLVIDGVEYDDFTVSSTTIAAPTLTFDFDSGDVVVEDGEEVEAELMLRFKALALGDEGQTVIASMTSTEVDAIEAEGADDLGATQLKGSVTGDEHTLRTDGIILAAGDMSASVEVVDGDDNDQATYTLEFEVTAFGEDFYVPFGAIASTTLQTDEGVSFDFLDGDNDIVTVVAASTTANLDSTADEDDGAFVVREGDTETFTLTVDYIPGNAAPVSYKVLLQEVSFRLNGVLDSAADEQEALPEADYRTNAVNILN